MYVAVSFWKNGDTDPEVQFQFQQDVADEAVCALSSLAGKAFCGWTTSLKDTWEQDVEDNTQYNMDTDMEEFLVATVLPPSQKPTPLY